MQEIIYLLGGHQIIDLFTKKINSMPQHLLHPGSQGIKCQQEDQRHDKDERRNGGKTPRKDPVDPFTSLPFLTLHRFDHGTPHQFFDKGKTHVGYGSGAIHPPFLFHLKDDMLHHFLFIFREFQSPHHSVISLYHLRRRKAHGDLCASCMILYEMHDPVNAPVHRTIMIGFITEILLPRTLLILCHMNRMLYQLIDTFILCGSYGNHRDPQQFFHLIDADRASVPPHLIHHIQRKDDGNIQFDQLHGQIQISFDIRGIHDIDDPPGLLSEDILSGNDLLIRIRGQRINTRKIHHLREGLSLDRSGLPVYRNTREIPHMLV